MQDFAGGVERLFDRNEALRPRRWLRSELNGESEYSGLRG